MRRDPERYVDRFGETAFRIKYADAHWHVWRLLGKLSNSIYVFAPAR
jgi:hypothetical protein